MTTENRSGGVEDFVGLIKGDPSLQQQVEGASDIGSVVKIASGKGIQVSESDLRGFMDRYNSRRDSFLSNGSSPDLRQIAGSRNSLACTCCGSRTSNACTTN